MNTQHCKANHRMEIGWKLEKHNCTVKTQLGAIHGTFEESFTLDMLVVSLWLELMENDLMIVVWGLENKLEKQC